MKTLILVSLLPMIVLAQPKNLRQFSLTLEQGKYYNHPTFAVWLETVDGQFIQPLFVTKSLATGTYRNADAGNGRWKREGGEARRPATLPYFLHKRGVKAFDGTYLPTPTDPIPDAYTGATPTQSTTLLLIPDKPISGKVKILMEVNQPWDYNAVWYNHRFPDNIDFLTSGQPSLVYMVEIDTENLEQEYYLNPIGHGDPIGASGKIFTDISGHTTARDIFKTIKINILNSD
ncbi:MAG TPA: hypothetical protein PK990_04990 [Salinivirgaceae bacterium]|nr:hypothetical protein [Salinivirgaceae bacterium]